MAIRVVRLGSPREPNEGPRIGTVRRPPRGVRKQEYAKLDFYDVWLPQIAPSAALIAKYKKMPETEASWKAFDKLYVRELSSPDKQRLLDLLAALSRTVDFSLGCYCENERRCHRSILSRILKQRGASLV